MSSSDVVMTEAESWGKMPPGANELRYERSPRWSESLPSAASGRVSVVRKMLSLPRETGYFSATHKYSKCVLLHREVRGAPFMNFPAENVSLG